MKNLLKNIKIIVGLGNPESVHKSTRHNVGFWFIEKIQKYYNITCNSKLNFFGDIGVWETNGKKIYLLKPMTYMNLSGKSVFSVSCFYKIPLKNIMIVHDELDLLPGTIRFKYGYGHNGHNGIRNILSFFQKKKIYKLSVGIGRPKEKYNVASYVLSKPNIQDKKKIICSLKKVILNF